MRMILPLALLGLLAACGESTVNRDACTTYIEHLNGLACFADDVSVGSTCPATLDVDDAPNCTDFYECLADNAACVDGDFVNTAEECGACL